MKAYSSYQKRKQREANEQFVLETMEKYIEHADLVVLMVLHDKFGFGKDRLERFFIEIAPMYEHYKRYMADNDKTRFGDVDRRTNKFVERDDTWKLKQDLKAVGFDYDAVVARLTVCEEGESDGD